MLDRLGHQRVVPPGNGTEWSLSWSAIVCERPAPSHGLEYINSCAEMSNLVHVFGSCWCPSLIAVAQEEQPMTDSFIVDDWITHTAIFSVNNHVSVCFN